MFAWLARRLALYRTRAVVAPLVNPRDVAVAELVAEAIRAGEYMMIDLQEPGDVNWYAKFRAARS